MSNWVRFHEELTQGEKRGLPRATRFVFMELSLKARARKGTIFLPIGMTDLEAVHDLLGGNRKEVVDAVKALTAGDAPMVRFETIEGKRALVVASWSVWNPTDPTGAERQARYRNGRRDGPSNGPSHGDGDGGGDGSRHAPIVSVTSTSARARATLSLLSSGSSSSEIPEAPRGESPSGTRLATAAVVSLTDALTDELRAAASMIGVADVQAAWAVFTGTRNGRQLSNGVNGEWQAFCARWRAKEATERARRGAPGDDPKYVDPQSYEASQARKQRDKLDLAAEIQAKLARAKAGDRG